MKPPRQSLNKGEILRGYQAFSDIIVEGESLQRGALRCFFKREPDGKRNVRVGFSVSRSVHDAVERNRARRWMREAYRRNKTLLDDAASAFPLAAGIVFLLRVRGRLSRQKNSYVAIEQAMIFLLKELRRQLAGKT